MDTLLLNNINTKTQQSPTLFHPRLAWMMYYQKVHSVKIVCEKFNISRKTFYKWWNRYYSSGFDPNSLFDKSRKPHHSPFATNMETIQKIINAKINTNFGVRKLRTYLIENYNIKLSEHTIWKILKKHFYTADTKHQPEILINNTILPGDEIYVSIYTTLIGSSGFKIYIFNSIDIFSRLRVAKLYTNTSITDIIDFLNYISQCYPFDIIKIKLIDEKYFTTFSEAIKNTNKGKISKANKYEKDIIEEIHSADEEMFFKKNSFETTQDLARKLDQYILYYNNTKPNNALNGLTPIQKLRTINIYRNIVYFDYRR